MDGRSQSQGVATPWLCGRRESGKNANRSQEHDQALVLSTGDMTDIRVLLVALKKC